MTLNGTEKKLSRNQKRAIAALLSNRRIADAAESIGVGKRTLDRWLKQPGFISALHTAETEAIGAAVRALMIDLTANHDVMRAIRDDKDGKVTARVRLSAAQSLDASLLRWRELLGVEERLERLEVLMFK